MGATVNIILTAVLAKGKTIIDNAAMEPEIVDVCNFLNEMGAKISGIGTRKVEIIGVDKLKPVKYLRTRIFSSNHNVFCDFYMDLHYINSVRKVQRSLAISGKEYGL